MNKAEMVDALEAKLGGRKQAVTAVEAVVELITLTVAKGDKVAISGFGTFEKQARNARTGRNPRTRRGREDQEDLGAALPSGHRVQGGRLRHQGAARVPGRGQERAASTGAVLTTPATGTAKKAAASTTTAKKAAPATRTAAPAAKKAAPATRTTAAAKKAAPAKTATTARRTAKKA